MDKLQEYAETVLADVKSIHSVEDALQSLTVRVTGMLFVTALAVWISSRSTTGGSSSGKKKSKKKSKGRTKGKVVKKKVMTEEETIKDVINRFEKEYEQGLTKLWENFDPSSETMQYERNYYNEMLLHLLLDLDGVHLGNLEGDKKEEVRLQRKAAIKKIQLELKKLDKLEKK